MAWAYWSKKSTSFLNSFSIVVASATIDYNGVAWSPKLGLFVAVGRAQSGGINYARSSDGISWTTGAIGQDNLWRSIVWSDFLELFVATSSDGTNRIATTDDGINWTLRSTALAGQWNQIACSEDLDLLIVSRIAGSSADTRFNTSDDSITWTTRSIVGSSITSFNNRSVTWSPVFEKFYSTGLDSNLFSSVDGINWSDVTYPNAITNNQTIWASPSKSLVLLTQANNNVPPLYSLNGTSFNVNSGSISVLRLQSFAEDAFGRIVAAPLGGNTFFTSNDGINWQQINSVGTNPTYIANGGQSNITYSSSLNRFVFVAHNYIASN